MVETNPFATLQQIMSSYIVSRCLHVVAELGVADVLDETPRTAAELAVSVNANSDALHRVMSLLSAYSIFEAKGDKFQHSSASRLLKSNHPNSMRALVRNFGSSLQWSNYQMLEYSVKTGLPASDKAFPGGIWAYLAQNPEASATFNAAMASKAHSQIAAIMAVYDFSGYKVIGDIGGGLGHLLRAILDTAPGTKGVLFDLPRVIDQVKELASERLTLQAGNFFTDTLPACNAYLLMEVIHDWTDEQAVAILKAIRQAAPSHSKLLLIEVILSDDPGPDWSKVLDVHMMTMNGGRQRTRQEYIALFERTGFSFQRQIDTAAGIAILEATPT